MDFLIVNVRNGMQAILSIQDKFSVLNIDEDRLVQYYSGAGGWQLLHYFEELPYHIVYDFQGDEFNAFHGMSWRD